MHKFINAKNKILQKIISKFIQSVVDEWIKGEVKRLRKTPFDRTTHSGKVLEYPSEVFGFYRLFHIITPDWVSATSFQVLFTEMLRGKSAIRELTWIEDHIVIIYDDNVVTTTERLCLIQMKVNYLPEKNYLLDSSNVNLVIERKSAKRLQGLIFYDFIYNFIANFKTFKQLNHQVLCWSSVSRLFNENFPLLYYKCLTVMTCRIYQLYPLETQYGLIKKFFQIYTHWDWKKPIKLTSFETEYNVSLLYRIYLIENFLEKRQYDGIGYHNKVFQPCQTGH